MSLNHYTKEKYEKELPRYIKLCQLEYESLCSAACVSQPSPNHTLIFKVLFFSIRLLLKITIALLVFLGLGHVLTNRGRLAFQIVINRYYLFLITSLGIWTKSSANAYNLTDIDIYRVDCEDPMTFRLDPEIRREKKLKQEVFNVFEKGGIIVKKFDNLLCK